jgi:hypothetical protein
MMGWTHDLFLEPRLVRKKPVIDRTAVKELLERRLGKK